MAVVLLDARDPAIASLLPPRMRELAEAAVAEFPSRGQAVKRRALARYGLPREGFSFVELDLTVRTLAEALGDGHELDAPHGLAARALLDGEYVGVASINLSS